MVRGSCSLLFFKIFFGRVLSTRLLQSIIARGPQDSHSQSVCGVDSTPGARKRARPAGGLEGRRAPAERPRLPAQAGWTPGASRRVGCFLSGPAVASTIWAGGECMIWCRWSRIHPRPYQRTVLEARPKGPRCTPRGLCSASVWIPVDSYFSLPIKHAHLT